MPEDLERQLQVWPPISGLWSKIAASKSIAAIISADLSPAEDAMLVEFLPDFVGLARMLAAIVQRLEVRPDGQA
jgi:hypothetical protein